MPLGKCACLFTACRRATIMTNILVHFNHKPMYIESGQTPSLGQQSPHPTVNYLSSMLRLRDAHSHSGAFLREKQCFRDKPCRTHIRLWVYFLDLETCQIACSLHTDCSEWSTQSIHSYSFLNVPFFNLYLPRSIFNLGIKEMLYWIYEGGLFRLRFHPWIIICVVESCYQFI